MDAFVNPNGGGERIAVGIIPVELEWNLETLRKQRHANQGRNKQPFQGHGGSIRLMAS
jgi:hypothetical protein